MTETTNKVREGQVFLQMDNLKDRLSELEKSVTEMKARLGSVLRNDTVDSEGKPGKDPDLLVPLASDIRASASRVNMVNMEITGLLQELEL